ncbi:MAG TPA: LLM class flavin-dependent oxidoreductase [Thermomicrobiales bacterium]|nr:LLM class flavin-dependent oxidoreductase [Thermomicrobiales bacterium]
MDLSRVGFGIAGALGTDLIRELAPKVEAAGFHTLWINDTPTGDSLAMAAAAAAVTSHIRFGTGVIPIDRKPPAEIVRQIVDLEIPVHRLVLGIGSGRATTGALGLVRDSITAIKQDLGVQVVVGALGPRMRRVGAQDGDGILLNWLTPKAALEARQALKRDSDEVGKTDSRLITYVRTAYGEASVKRLAIEAANYGQNPFYAANFVRQGADGIQASVSGDDGETLRAGLTAYLDAVDEVVVRAVTPDDTIAQLEVLLEQIAG